MIKGIFFVVAVLRAQTLHSVLRTDDDGKLDMERAGWMDGRYGWVEWAV